MKLIYFLCREFNKNAIIELDFYKTMKEEQMREILRSYCILQARIAKAVCLSAKKKYFSLISFNLGLKKLDEYSR